MRFVIQHINVKFCILFVHSQWKKFNGGKWITVKRRLTMKILQQYIEWNTTSNISKSLNL